MAVFAGIPAVCSSDEFDGKETEHIRLFESAYRPILGKRVVVDALVWHYIGKSGRGGGEIITPTGQVIFVRDAYTGSPTGVKTQRLPQGKLVRVRGILEFGPGPTIGGIVMGTGDRRSHLNLAMDSFEIIEEAKSAWPTEIKPVDDAETKRPGSEQDGARQPATAPESKPEGEENPEPQSEARSR